MATPNNRKNQQKKENDKNNFKQDKQEKVMQKAEEAACQLREESRSLGSYTGLSHDGDIPEQDADDL